MAARMAILKAARQLAFEANVHVYIRKFSVINQARLRNSNPRVITGGPQGLRGPSTSIAPLPWVAQVGAVGIDAKLDCDAFASTHSATSHYDRASFVGACLGPTRWTRWTHRAHCMVRRSGMAAGRRVHMLRCVARDQIKPQQ